MPYSAQQIKVLENQYTALTSRLNAIRAERRALRFQIRMAKRKISTGERVNGWTEAVTKILYEADSPLATSEIIKRIITRFDLVSVDPRNAAVQAMCHSRNNGRFKRVERGVYTLTTEYRAELDAQE